MYCYFVFFSYFLLLICTYKVVVIKEIMIAMGTAVRPHGDGKLVARCDMADTVDMVVRFSWGY